MSQPEVNQSGVEIFRSLYIVAYPCGFQVDAPERAAFEVLGSVRAHRLDPP